MEFKSFPKIQRLDNIPVRITQKMDGTNALIAISEDGEVKAGSRSRWITPGKETDNYGFAEFVKEKEEIIKSCLAPGYHYGEWCGPGINSGEGLKTRTLFLFGLSQARSSFHSTLEGINIFPVPELWRGSLPQTLTVPDSLIFSSQIQYALHILRADGSKAVPGFMRPEGLIIQIGDRVYKKHIDWRNNV